MQATIDYNVWIAQTKAEYRRRIGISWEDGGGDDEQLKSYFDDQYSPTEVVDRQIEKYDLNDITDRW